VLTTIAIELVMVFAQSPRKLTLSELLGAVFDCRWECSWVSISGVSDLVFPGTQLFALGTIGEYPGRMHFRLPGRPSYAVRSLEGLAEIRGCGRDGSEQGENL
jgi:hypothetical protein